MKRSAILLVLVFALCSSFILFADTDAGLINTDMSFKTPVLKSDYRDYLEKGVRSDSIWYTYPKTFEIYHAIMLNWEKQYPNLCKLYNLGLSPKEKFPIYALNITADVNRNTAKPRYLQTSTLHGDEFAGYMITLHMIDTLLSSYGKDPRITALLDSISLFFCPVCSPDYTYCRGKLYSGSVVKPINYDLNADYTCSCPLGLTTHKYIKQVETKALVWLTDIYRFNLHTDLHSGMEAACWPYSAIPRKHCDIGWSVWAAKRFVDQVHKVSTDTNYMTSTPDHDGMGNYYEEMYERHGARLDYMSIYHHCRGLHLELSDIKMTPESELKNLWIWLKESLFQYYELLYTGIQGVVVDAKTKQPIYNAHIYSNKPDEFTDSADVYTDSAGAYVRFIDTGTYTMTFSHPDYSPKTAEVQVTGLNKKYILSIELDPLPVKLNALQLKKLGITILPCSRGVQICFYNSAPDNVQIGIYTMKGTLVTLLPVNSQSITWDCKNSTGVTVGNGCYIIKIKTGGQEYARSVTIAR